MSRVYFHSPSGDAELNGSELHHLKQIVSDAALRTFALDDPAHVERLRSLIRPDHYLRQLQFTDSAFWVKWLQTCLNIREDVLVFDGRPVETFALVLNTALLGADDVMRLAARVDGQCEIHAYVEGPNRAWVADIIDRGLEGGLYRRGLRPGSPFGGQGPWRSQGWEDVQALLRSRDDEPVVMSYSVCASFPNPDVLHDWPDMPDGWRPDSWSEQDWAELDDEERSEWWEEHVSVRFGEQPVDIQWEQAMDAIRTGGMGLELKPDDWGTFRFGHTLTALDLYADDWRERLKTALPHPEGPRGE